MIWEPGLKFLCVCVYMRALVRVCLCLCLYEMGVWFAVNVRLCGYVRLFASVSVRVCLCLCVCVCVSVHI